MDVTIRPDYLRMTIHGFKDYEAFISEYLTDFGSFVEMPYGSKGFNRVLRAGKAAFIHISDKGGFWSLELKGVACQSVKPELFQDLALLARYGLGEAFPDFRINVTRLDLAVDGSNVTPYMAHNWAVSGDVKCRANRTNQGWHDSFNRPRDDQSQVGCATMEFGNHKSPRMLRIYNKHGYNRIELELKEDHANKAFIDLLAGHVTTWLSNFKALLSSFIKFIDAPWWDEFMEGASMVMYKVLNYTEQSLEKAVNWFRRQVSACALGLRIKLGPLAFDSLMMEGYNRLDKYKALFDIGSPGLSPGPSSIGGEKCMQQGILL